MIVVKEAPEGKSLHGLKKLGKSWQLSEIPILSLAVVFFIMLPATLLSSMDSIPQLKLIIVGYSPTLHKKAFAAD